MSRRWLLALGLSLLACKIEPVGEVEPAAEPRRVEGWFSLWEPEVAVDEEASLVEAELRRQLALLTNVALEGRRPGTEGAGLTASHLERTMQEIGLSPAGVGGGWRQPVVVRIRETSDGHLELGGSEEEEGEVLRHGEGIVLRRVEAAGVWNGEHVVVDAGWGISAPELGHDDYADLEVKGRIVLVRHGVPSDGGFAEDAVETYGAVERKLSRARELGAEGCLVATGALQAESAWADIVAKHRQPRILASDLGEPRAKPTPLVGLLSAEAEAATRAWLSAVAAEEGAVANVTASVTTNERTVVDPNIVGRIAGNERPSEVVVVVAHWDAGGTSPALPEGGAAIDNATGVAALLAAARKSTDWVRRGRMPERSLAFVATASDSLDLAGTHALLAAGPLRRSEIVAVVALDALSVHPGGPTLGVMGGDASSIGRRLATLRSSIRRVKPDAGGVLTPSHVPALAAGTPAVTLTRHDPEALEEDSYDPTGPVDDLRDDVSLVFDLIWSYAESTDRAVVVAPGDPSLEASPDAG